MAVVAEMAALACLPQTGGAAKFSAHKWGMSDDDTAAAPFVGKNVAARWEKEISCLIKHVIY